MNDYENLIQFLEQKANDINNGHKLTISKINTIHHDKLNKQYIRGLIGEFNKRQKTVAKILRAFDELVQLKKTEQQKGFIKLMDKLEKHLQAKADLVAQKKEKFDNEHPLYGYQPFYKNLINAYAKIEAYEKCNEIQNNITI